MTERLIVVGGVAAGMSAAAKARRARPEMQAVVYERGSHISYAACGLPYFIAGDLAGVQDLIVRTPEQMAKQGVEVHLRHEVTAIDAGRQTVAVRDLDTGATFAREWTGLVIATGARPACPPLPGCDLEGVLSLRSLESGLAIRRFLDEKKPARAVIVGGGYIAVEMAESLRRLGLDVTMLVRSGKVLRSTIDDDLRPVVHAELARHGVALVEDSAVAFEGEGHVVAVRTLGGRYPCDLVVLGLGAQPNAELAAAAGVALGATGAIATDSHMCTNLPGIYAAGDCAEALHLVTGRPAYMPLGSTANKQGRVAGSNAAGQEATFGGIVGTMIVRCFDLAVGSTGLTAAAARALGYDVQETRIQAQDLSHYFPGSKEMHVKLVADGADGRLLGGQVAGPHRSIKRIDVLATALYAGLAVSDVQRLDLGYAPPFAPVWDPVLVAANVAARD